MNPYALHLTFPDQTTRLRRDHEKYLTLIDSIAFVHQHQRDIKTHRRGEQVIDYIEATLADIETANRIAHDVLGRSLDELPPQTRRLLQRIDAHVKSECARLSVRRADVRFSRRSLREAIAWGDTQLKIHLARLAELEYLVTHRSKTGGFDYELVYDAPEDAHTLRFPGLADIAALQCAYDAQQSGQTVARSASGRGMVGVRSAGSRLDDSLVNPSSTRLADDSPSPDAEPHCSRPKRQKPVVP